MDIKEMDLKDYCCLNRPRLRVDPEADASWFFGNRQVEVNLLSRIHNDFNIRGVPKCGIVGRFGYGKTHSLYHIKHILKLSLTNFQRCSLYYTSLLMMKEHRASAGGNIFMERC